MDDVEKMMQLTAHGLRDHPQICSLGGVGYRGSGTTPLALDAQEQPKALVYHSMLKKNRVRYNQCIRFEFELYSAYG